MAKTLPEFNFGRLTGGRTPFYEKFLDGQIWELSIEDAPGTKNIRSMQTSIAGAARRMRENDGKDIIVRTQVMLPYDEDGDPLDDEATLVVQAVTSTGEPYTNGDSED